MYLYRNLVVELDDDINAIKKKIASKLKIKEKDISNLEFYKKSIDARNKDHIFFVCSLIFNSESNIKNNKNLDVVSEDKVYPTISKEEIKCSYRPVVVGFGPSGMFAGLYLARKGLKPIIIEQGKDVDNRIKDVDNFLKNNVLDVKSNVVFGEGGAGTFSDGKLNTNNKDPFIRLVLNEFVNHGAPKDILYLGKPHIGTDKLVSTVKSIREEIISLGGSVLFSTTFKSFIIKDNRIIGVNAENGSDSLKIDTETVFLCIGHSSNETYKYLYENNIELAKKPFGIGLRIQHKQEVINKAQYGKFFNHKALPAAPYKLITHLENGRTVFSFCNCPGGEVINSSSDEGGIVCNGMSYYARSGEYCNSALLVNVNPSDIEGDNPLNAIKFQRDIEEKCFKINNSYTLTAQKVVDYMDKKETKSDLVLPMQSRYIFGKLNDILPSFVEESLILGIKKFNGIIKDFINEDALLFGVETRSSSPITILRNKEGESVSLQGLYPCGEGAGYAGGITTSAIDGIRSAIYFINKIS